MDRHPVTPIGKPMVITGQLGPKMSEDCDKPTIASVDPEAGETSVEPTTETMTSPTETMTSPTETTKPKQRRQRRKKRHHKAYVPGNSKSMRRVKRLGYTPEHNKRGYRLERAVPRVVPQAAAAEPDHEGCLGTAVQVAAEYPRSSSRKKVIFYSYTKVNGKSTRYLHETPEEQAARRAKYKERNRKYAARETEEQHRQRLERRRLRRIADRAAAGLPVDLPVVGCRRRRRAAVTAAAPQVVVETPEPQEPEEEPEIQEPLPDQPPPWKDVDDGQLDALHRECAEFDRYVTEKLREAMAMRLEIAYWQHEPEQVNSEAAATSYSSPVSTNGYRSSAATQKPPSGAVLYSNDPVDPEIALLETSDETFVPVQVIIQTCDDFDDMLEIEENA